MTKENKKTNGDSFYLPYKLSPQGWLIDVLLGQLYADSNKDLKKIYQRGSIADDETFFAKNRLLFLNPNHKNKLKEKFQKEPVKISNDPVKNKKNKKDYVDFMLGLTPTQQAVLQPYIRIFLKYETEDKEQKQRDIIFKTFTDINDITRYDYGRMGSAGIEKVSVKREMPSFGLTNTFNVNIDYFFSSMSTFVKGHPADLVNDSKRDDYLKLLTQGGKIEKIDGKTQRVGKEVLCLEYGWNFSESTPFDILPKDIREKIRTEEKKRFEISWIGHDFNFQQNGEVSLSARYVAVPERIIQERLNIDNKKAATIFHEIRSVEPLFDKDDEKLVEYKKLITDYETITNEIKKFQKGIKTKNKCEKVEAKDKLENLNINLKQTLEQLAAKSADVFVKKIISNNQMLQASFYSTRRGDSKTHNLFTGIGIVPSTAEILNKKTSSLKSKVNDSKKNKKTTTNKENEPYRLFKIDKKKFEMVPKDALKNQYVIKHLKVEAKKVLESLQKEGDVSIFSKKILEPKQKNNKKTVLENIDKKLASLTYSHHATKTKEGGSGHLESTYGNFYFFPLRALLTALYQQTDDERDIITGLGNIVHRFNGKPAWVNIGDIPIELGVFKKWFYHNIIVEGNVKWKFGDFIDDIMETLIPRILRQYSSESGTNFGSIVNHHYSLSEAPKKELLKNLFFDSQGSEETLGQLVKLMKKPTKKMKKGMVFYGQMITEQVQKQEAVSTLFASKMTDRTFKREKDHEDGMFHLNIGEDRGILMDIGFQNVNDDYLQSALLFDKNQDMSMPFLKSAYTSTPMMFGNNLFNEGGYFVISLNPLGVSPREDPGIRGYYRVSSVTDVIAPGSYTTSVQGTNIFKGQSKKQKNKNKPNAEVKKPAGVEKETNPKPIGNHVYKGIYEHIKDILKFVNIQKTFNLKYKDKCEVKSK